MNKIDPLSCSMMALVGAIWGLHGPALKLAFAAGLTFPQLVLGEALVGACFFGAAVILQGGRWPREFSFWLALIAMGMAGSGVALFLFWSYRLGPVSIGATLLFLYVPFTQIINFVITRRMPVVHELWASVLVVVGAALTTNFLNAASEANLRGAPFAVLAALCFAAYYVLTAPLGQSATPALRCFVSCGVSSAVMLVVATLVGWPVIPTGIAAGHVFLWLVSLGLLWQVIPLFLIMRFVPRTGSGLGSILTSTELPVAVLSSCLIFGERLHWSQVLGIVLVLAGIALPHLPRRIARKPDGADVARSVALPEEGAS